MNSSASRSSSRVVTPGLTFSSSIAGQAAVGVVVLQGLGLVVVDLQPASDGFLGVVIALDERARVALGRRIVLDVVDLTRSLALAPSREPIYERVIRSFEGDHGD